MFIYVLICNKNFSLFFLFTPFSVFDRRQGGLYNRSVMSYGLLMEKELLRKPARRTSPSDGSLWRADLWVGGLIQAETTAEKPARRTSLWVGGGELAAAEIISDELDRSGIDCRIRW